MDKPGSIDELDILPLQVSMETGCCHLHSDLMTVRGNDGHGSELEDGVCCLVQNVDILLLGIELREDRP